MSDFRGDADDPRYYRSQIRIYGEGDGDGYGYGSGSGPSEMSYCSSGWGCGGYARSDHIWIGNGAGCPSEQSEYCDQIESGGDGSGMGYGSVHSDDGVIPYGHFGKNAATNDLFSQEM